MRWRGVTLALGALVAFAEPSAAEKGVTTSDQWQQTDKSMAELVEDGYELVSVVAPSNQTRTYFFRKPRKLVKCTEQTTLDGPLPPLPKISDNRQSFAAFAPGDLPKLRTEVECADLVRPQ